MRLGGWVGAGVLLGVTVLSGCASDDGRAGEGAPTAAPSTTSSAGADAVDSSGPDASPAGEATTAPGSVLDLGDEATVLWRPTPDLEGVLELRVDEVREGRPRDFAGLVASGSVEGAQPYYVDVRLTNAGESDLGGFDVPLYLRDTSDSLGPPWGFEEPFAPCRSRPLPRSFPPGETAATCLVFFARTGAAYDAMAFQPAPEQEAITWTGDVTGAGRDRADGPSRRRR
jgi:hypothetical protein